MENRRQFFSSAAAVAAAPSVLFAQDAGGNGNGTLSAPSVDWSHAMVTTAQHLHAAMLQMVTVRKHGPGIQASVFGNLAQAVKSWHMLTVHLGPNYRSGELAAFQRGETASLDALHAAHAQIRSKVPVSTSYQKSAATVDALILCGGAAAKTPVKHVAQASIRDLLYARIWALHFWHERHKRALEELGEIASSSLHEGAHLQRAQYLSGPTPAQIGSALAGLGMNVIRAAGTLAAAYGGTEEGWVAGGWAGVAVGAGVIGFSYVEQQFLSVLPNANSATGMFFNLPPVGPLTPASPMPAPPGACSVDQNGYCSGCTDTSVDLVSADYGGGGGSGYYGIDDSYDEMEIA